MRIGKKEGKLQRKLLNMKEERQQKQVVKREIPVRYKGKKIFAMGVVKHCHRFPGEAVEFPFLETFRT